MSTLSWNEIRLRASAFCEKWKEIAPKAREEADANSKEKRKEINEKSGEV